MVKFKSLKVIGGGLALLLTLASLPAMAGEGRIPLWEPTVIDQPGHYVLTRDISADTGPVINIQADGVTLDGNGYTISLSSTTEPVIQIGGVGVSQTGIVLSNSKVSGGLHGIRAINPRTTEDDMKRSIERLLEERFPVKPLATHHRAFALICRAP